MVKKGLGRGLSALIPGLASDNNLLEEVSVDAIKPNPNQPRKSFDQEVFAELVASVKQHGLVQPLVLRRKDNGYELVAGERRWRAAKEAGLKTVPAVVKDSTDIESLEIALIENIQRENLNPIEEALAYQRLAEISNCTHADLAQKVGKNRTTVTNLLRLLQLPDEIKALVLENKVSSGHARALLICESKEKQMKLAEKIIKEDLSVRQVEQLAKLANLEETKSSRTTVPLELKRAARKLAKVFGFKVKAKVVRGKTKLEIEVDSLEKLSELAKKLQS